MVFALAANMNCEVLLLDVRTGVKVEEESGYMKMAPDYRDKGKDGVLQVLNLLKMYFRQFPQTWHGTIDSLSSRLASPHSTMIPAYLRSTWSMAKIPFYRVDDRDNFSNEGLDRIGEHEQGLNRRPDALRG